MKNAALISGFFIVKILPASARNIQQTLDRSLHGDTRRALMTTLCCLDYDFSSDNAIQSVDFNRSTMGATFKW